jgi:REP element-mobilizing transposase RayT
MPGSRVRLYCHYVWATWDRLPLITAERKRRIYAAIQAECERMGAEVISIGGVQNHVHVLVQQPATVLPSEIVRQMKGVSSHLVSSAETEVFFKWQGGYSLDSVSASDIARLRAYINNQETHHRIGSIDADWELGDT